MDRDVGVVVLCLGELGHPVHERDRLREGRELEGPLEGSLDLTPIHWSHDTSIYDRREMTTSTEIPRPATVGADGSRRAGRELLLESVFEPLAGLLLPLLVRLRVAPPVIVLANAGAGVLAALAIGRGSFVVGALLLQVKTLLDNADGRLARATGRVTLLGRYLDTIADLVVNAALFAALAHVTGQPLLALAGFVALMLVLTVDFNVSELAQVATGAASATPPPSGSRVERALGGLYACIFAPQDRIVRALSARRFMRAVGAAASPAAERAYFDRVTLSALANLGLTTQLVALGACLVLGLPQLYLWLAILSMLLLAPLQIRRERLARRAALG